MSAMPSHTDPDRPESPARTGGDHVELRVHGVAGGQAEELLDVEPAMRVAGDGLSGFFRWRSAADTETVPGVRREIFAWGNLTSGRASRALWLMLLPFMLVNLAYWMRPGRAGTGPGSAPRTARAVYGASVRLLALALTMLITLAAAGVGMDVAAWQCSAQAERCATAHPWSAFLASAPPALSAPGTVLLLGAVAPLAVVAVLWRLSRSSGGEYEVVPAPEPAVATEAAPLSDPGFWRNGEVLARLRSAHVAVALNTVSLLLLVPPLRHDLGGGFPAPGVWAAGALLAAVLGLVTAVATAGVLLPGTDPRWNARADRLCALLRDAALIVGVAAAVYALWPRPGWEAVGRLPGHSSTLTALFAVQGVLVLVLVAAAVVLYRSGRGEGRAAMRGLAGPATAALGALLGGVFSAALVYQAALWLGDCPPLAGPEAGCLALEPPTAYSWLQLAFVLEAAMAIAAVAVLTLRLRRATRSQLSEVTEQYARSVRDRRTWEIARARALGRMTESLPAVLTAFVVPVVPLIALVLYAAVSGTALAGPVPADTALAALSSGGGGFGSREVLAVLVGVGSFLGGLCLAALVWIGRSAYRDRPTRQAVGALWDVGTFWPRAAHPLAPPSYAERAVPQLAARVARMAREGADTVLSGHSQGSVLAAATVWQLPEDCVERAGLVTHGSPLDRLYSRYFPAYFNARAFTDLERRVPGWRNLWRVTDAIADPVRTVERSPDGSERMATVPPEEPLPDPRSYDPLPGEVLRPEVLGHSRYTGDPEYAESLWKVLSAMADRRS
ncbi:hypothetical protein [Nocardiopsis sp. CNT312]|uniref:hypothetical protein n=1 Tax=Nocardiopsis sp. CNT312 TaxID=1137268 RepID=UPI0004BB60F7